MSTVKCQKAPKKENPEWDFSTLEVKKVLQKSFTKLTTGLRNAGRSDISDVQITITTKELSKRYCMCILIMPESVLRGSKKLDDIPSVFQSGASENQVPLERPFWDLIRNWMYTKNERAMFRNASYRQSLQLKTMNLNLLMQYMNPKIMNLSGKKCVVVAIDLIKVFHDMLSDPTNPKERFMINISDFKKTDDGQHVFTVKKSEDTRKQQSDVARELQRSLSKAVRP